VWGEAHELIRAAKRYGLLVAVSRGRDPAATVLDIIGPLSLFHDTGVYGGALAALVPLLADIARFELTVTCDFGYGPSLLRLAPPVLLPPVVVRGKPSIAARLARDLAKAAPARTIDRDPPPIAAGSELVFPDFLIDGAIAIELIGFATADYLAAQLARYTLAGVRPLLCVHDKRVPDEDDETAPEHPKILRFRGRLTAAMVLARLEETA
jgi:predicted nuclease of restriction endonuclease-like RecB superfamily